MRENLRRVMVLTSIVLISSVALSLINEITAPEIAKQRAIKREEMLQSIFPSVTEYTHNEENDLYEVYSNGQRIGYAFETKGKGYGGDIEILVGINENKTIEGIRIIKHTETPGYGAGIIEGWFTDQFSNKSIDDIRLKKDGGEIDAITGATISSKGVVNTVYETYMEKIKLIEAGEEK